MLHDVSPFTSYGIHIHEYFKGYLQNFLAARCNCAFSVYTQKPYIICMGGGNITLK